MTHEDDMHERYFHPDLAAIRKRVKKRLHADIDALLGPEGYVQRGNDWNRVTRFARTLVSLQPSSGGYCCYLNVMRYQRLHKWEWVPRGAVHSGWRIGSFTRASEDHLDQLWYVDLDDAANPLRQKVLTILAERVVPFLKRAHKPWGYLFFPPRVADMMKARS